MVRKSKYPAPKTDGKLPYLFIAPGFLCLCLVIAYPFFYTLLISFTDKNVMYDGTVFVGLDNYKDTFADRTLPATITRSFIWTFGVVLGQLVLGLIAALALNRVWKARTAVRLMLIIPWAFPTIVIAYSWRFILDGTFGVLNDLLLKVGFIAEPVSWISQPTLAMPIAIIVAVWSGFPFMMVSIIAAITTIPDDLFEAARLDGADYWQELRYITLPFIAPVMLSVVILRTIWTFNGFDLLFLLTGGGPVNRTTTLPIYAFSIGWTRYDVGRMAAISMLMIALLGLVILFYFWAFRRREA
ncbi:carbohydrate ABC transporter permease [Brucella gallinifaecis]|uniref:carbohydrate ABC transporter permease n=1 Tax=Brucella gallinifaecis TaxID=215590 RepID=UPI002361349B|nr:sugar ABC transporter permease [Brucella gallinifaecis]